MNCPYCNSPLPPDAPQCPACGAQTGVPPRNAAAPTAAMSDEIAEELKKLKKEREKLQRLREELEDDYDEDYDDDEELDEEARARSGAQFRARQDLKAVLEKMENATLLLGAPGRLQERMTAVRSLLADLDADPEEMEQECERSRATLAALKKKMTIVYSVVGGIILIALLAMVLFFVATCDRESGGNRSRSSSRSHRTRQVRYNKPVVVPRRSSPRPVRQVRPVRPVRVRRFR